MINIVIYVGAAFFEILGCFSFWNYFKLHKTPYWLLIGLLSLIVFAFLLTKVQIDFAGKSYAIYGGIYIAASLFWMYFVEHQIPDKWDIVGSIVCVFGALIILITPR